METPAGTTKENPIPNRFDYVQYDATATETQAKFKSAFVNLTNAIEGLLSSRARAIAITKMEEGTARGTGLATAVARWPTPRGRDWKAGGKDCLPTAVQMWPTPRATDGERGQTSQEGAQKEMARGHGVDLPSAVILNASSPPTGQLNPTWVEWLQGFPLEWTALGSLGTRLFRVLRGSPSKD